MQLSLSKRVNFYKNVFWHASTTLEADEIFKIFNPSRDFVSVSSVLIAMDIVYSAEPPSTQIDSVYFHRPSLSTTHICFLSRISRKKNLYYSLLILSKLKISIVFSIYGPIEDEKYWDECMALIKNLPPNIKCTYQGPVNPELVLKVLSKYDIFLLPTLGENFGHVFVEAWLAGLFVITSDQTPWRKLESLGVGRDISLDSPNDFLNAIVCFHNYPLEKKLELKKISRNFGLLNSNSQVIIDSNLSLFNSAISPQ